MAIKLGTTDITQVKLGANTINEIYQGSTLIYSAGPGPAIDPDAQAFLTATGITDPTQESAVNQLVLDLKSANIWSKMQIIYPIVGGTATTHKYNLKDPQDTDAAFRLTFTGSFIHNADGVQPEAGGSSGFANTHWVINQQSFTNGVHWSSFIKTEVAGGGYTMGTNDWALINDYTSGTTDYWKAGTGSYLTFNNPPGSGYLMGTSNGTNYRAMYDDAGLLTSDTTGGITPDPIAPYLWAVNDSGTATGWSKDLANFFTIGEYLDATDSANLYTAITTFNTTLGR